MSSPMPTAGAPRPALHGFLIAWAVFWLLQYTVALQDFQRAGLTHLWEPLLWETTSFVVASAIAVLHWRLLPRLDALLQRPLRWFALLLPALPLLALAFVAAVFGLRHAVHALVGVPYLHDPWPRVFLFESLKFAMFYLLFTAIAFGMRSFAGMMQARVSAERAQAAGQEARLMQLTQQIEPHFLFNALNTIAEAIHTDPALAESLLLQLASLMRAATDLTRRPESTLGQEIELLRAYADIMVQRFAGRIDLGFEIEPAARECIVPTFVLQPLLENAFRHGVERASRRCRLRVRARREPGGLALEVEDDVGRLPHPLVFGVGLSNIQQRLASRYGARAGLALTALPGQGVLARIELPCAP